MGVLLALASAATYGLVDVGGGLLSRRASFIVVAFVGQASSLVVMLGVAALLPSEQVERSDLAWGALSGVGTGAGMLFLYRGMSRGAMSVVVPVSAVTSVALSVLVGVVLVGDRPSPTSWQGIALTGPALWLVSRERGSTGALEAPATVDALLASVGIAVQYLALAQVGADSGAWPVTAGRVSATATLLPVALASRSALRLSPRLGLGAALVGAMAAMALLLYLLATRQELVVVSVVVASLYPVLPVLLGVTVLHERLTAPQAVGMVLAAVAIVMLAIG